MRGGTAEVMSELDEIRRKYESGQLDHIKADLERFLTAHRQEIDCFREEQCRRARQQLPDETIVKFFIIHCRSINPASEISEQLAEIEREKWIQGVEKGCCPDPQQVALDWAKKFSAGWRAHRVTSIIYCFDRDKERYLKLLRPPLEQPRSA